MSDFRLKRNNVCAIASQAGRVRCNIENQGFNLQKNSGLNLEHAYSTDPDVMKAFYYLLQIAHLFLQMFEMGSLLRRLAQDFRTTPVGLFGSLKNIAKRLLECFRYFQLGEEPSKMLRARFGWVILLNTRSAGSGSISHALWNEHDWLSPGWPESGLDEHRPDLENLGH